MLRDSNSASTCSHSWMWSAVSGCWSESPNMFGLTFIKYIPGTLGTCQPFLPCGLRSDLPSHPERKSTEGGKQPKDMVLWCGMAVSLAGTGAPQNLHGVWRGHSSQLRSQVLCTDTGGPQVGIRDSEKSTLLAAHSVAGNSRCVYCKHSAPRLTLIPLP